MRPLRMMLVQVIAMALMAGSAHAFRVESNLGITATTPVKPSAVPPTRIVHWDLREFPECRIPFAIDSAGCHDSLATGGFSAIDAAFHSWGSVHPTPLQFVRTANASTHLAGRDGVNLMAFDSTNANGAFGAPLSGTLALTFVWTEAATARILESDVIFNDRDWQWNTATDQFTDVMSALVQPFNLAAGDTLRIRVDGGAVQSVGFGPGNVTENAATAAEVRDAIFAQLAGNYWVAIPGGRVRIQSGRMDGRGSIEVVGGTGGAPAAFGFPAGERFTRRADIETVCLHEIGHFIGLAHSSDSGTEAEPLYREASMYAFAPATGTKRALNADDVAGVNFLYTPDYGDLAEFSPGSYATIVRGPQSGRVLNGITLHVPDDGPGHLFGYSGQDSLRFEWLGQDIDDSDLECDPRMDDADAYDDGVVFPPELTLDAVNPVEVTIRYSDASRYDASDPSRVLYFNGYFDLDGDDQFSASDRHIWWSGTPSGGTIASSPNWTSASYAAGSILLRYDFVPTLAIPPIGIITRQALGARFRLDLGEDEGRVSNRNGDLAAATGVAQFGEVEDSGFLVRVEEPTAIHVARFVATSEPEGIRLQWSAPVGASPEVRLYRHAEGEDSEFALGLVVSGSEGGQFLDHTAEPGRIYGYRLGVFVDGEERRGPTATGSRPLAQLALLGVRPNPIERLGEVRFRLPFAAPIRLSLLGVDGRLLGVLAEGRYGAGEHSVPWRGRAVGSQSLSPGVYYVRLDAAEQHRITRVVVVR